MNLKPRATAPEVLRHLIINMHKYVQGDYREALSIQQICDKAGVRRNMFYKAGMTIEELVANNYLYLLSKAYAKLLKGERAHVIASMYFSKLTPIYMAVITDYMNRNPANANAVWSMVERLEDLRLDEDMCKAIIFREF